MAERRQAASKSVISILIGIAIQDGLITSVDDPVTKYLPELKNTGYDGVSIKSLHDDAVRN